MYLPWCVGREGRGLGRGWGRAPCWKWWNPQDHRLEREWSGSPAAGSTPTRRRSSPLFGRRRRRQSSGRRPWEWWRRLHEPGMPLRGMRCCCCSTLLLPPSSQRSHRRPLHPFVLASWPAASITIVVGDLTIYIRHVCLYMIELACERVSCWSVRKFRCFE